MRYAIIDTSGQVINTIEVEPEALLPTTSTDESGIVTQVPPSWSPPNGCSVQQSDVAGIGWSFVDGAFVAPISPVVETPIIQLPTLLDLQNQLATITAQINAYANGQS